MSDLVVQRMYYIGVIFHAMFYGIEVYMYFQSLYIYMCQPPSVRKPMFPYIAVGGLMAFIYAWAFAADAVYGQLMWIEHPNFPGGPVAYFEERTNIWIQVAGTFACMLADWLGEALLLYRCWIIWEGKLKIIVFPSLLLLGSMVTGFLTTVSSALPNDEFYNGKTVNFGVPWVSLSVATNVTLTIFICIRMLQARMRVNKCLEKCDLQVYTSILAMMIESTLPFSILGIIFAITYSKGWSLSVNLANIWGVFVVISPQLIILRVVMGRAWTRDIASRAGIRSSVAFRADTTNFTQGISIDSAEKVESTIVVSEQSEPSASNEIFAKLGD